MNDNLPCKTQRFSYDDCFYLGGRHKIRRGREEAERVKGKREEEGGGGRRRGGGGRRREEEGGGGKRREEVDSLVYYSTFVRASCWITDQH